MKNMKLKFIFLVIFFVIYGASFYGFNKYKSIEISDELDKTAKELQLSFDITHFRNSSDAKSIAKFIKSREDIVEIFSKAFDANETIRSKLRDKLYQKLFLQFESMQKKGVKVVLFSFANNITFLRVHKPSKYGDNLEKVRYSIKLTNQSQKKQIGFEQGKITHAFRNIFPIHDKNTRYIGCIDISYSSDNMQDVISNIHKIHTHFLVKRNVFDSKIWKLRGTDPNYKVSIENPKYMLSLGVVESHPKSLISKKMVANHREYILKNMSDSKQFSVYRLDDEYADVISFLPIKNIKNITSAYLVSYTSNEHIVDIVNFFKIINVLIFITLAIGLFLIYKQILIKHIMQEEIDEKTQELKDANIDLEEKIIQRTDEQNQLLSLFDRGDVSLFRWRNDEHWSIEYASNNTDAIFGYTRDEFLNENILYTAMVHQDDLPRVIEEVNNALQKDLDFFTHEPYRVTTKDSKEIWVLDNTLIIKDSKGNATHFLVYISDITELKHNELEIKAVKENLQQLVEKKTAENLKQREVLQQQNKMAAMGEMIGAIAHQWRQPLNALSINLQNLEFDYEDDLIDDKFLKDFIEKNNKTIGFMSRTIDDFRNFFRVDKEKDNFSVKKAIESSISMQSAQLKNYQIILTLDGDDFNINGYESEFLQVILNLINNAKDALIEANIESPTINIKLDNKQIFLYDNAGGIREDIIDRIFEPYFTTKEQGKGTGIGLYMSKMIIENNMGALLKVSNMDDGAMFIIDFSFSE